MNDILACPLCGALLYSDNKTFKCCGERTHSYDIARSGYVNLLPPGKGKNAKTGDDLEMIRARKDFLYTGYYDRYVSEAVSFASGFLKTENKNDIVMVDAGCGEGHHSILMSEKLEEIIKLPVKLFGFDASKHGVDCASKTAKRKGNTAASFFAAANIFDLPVKSGSVDLVTSLFAPIAADSFYNVLSDEGILLICSAGEKHLYEFREVLYDEVFLKKEPIVAPVGFELIDKNLIEYNIRLKSCDEISSLLKMTPFFYRSRQTNKNKLLTMEGMDVTVSVLVSVYRKIHK